MNQTFPAEAIVLDRQSFKEHDSRISVFSLEKGRMDLVVRGTKRSKSKMAGHIEPISQVNLMVVKGKHYDYAGSVVSVNSFSLSKNNYDLLVDIGQVMRMLKRVVEPGEVDFRLYLLLKKYLEANNLKTCTKDKSDLNLILFAFRFASLMGYSPELYACSVCGIKTSESQQFFNHEQGGIICETCRLGQRASVVSSIEVIGVMKKIGDLNIEHLFAMDIEENLALELKKIVIGYFRYNLDYDMWKIRC